MSMVKELKSKQSFQDNLKFKIIAFFIFAIVTVFVGSNVFYGLNQLKKNNDLVSFIELSNENVEIENSVNKLKGKLKSVYKDGVFSSLKLKSYQSFEYNLNLRLVHHLFFLILNFFEETFKIYCFISDTSPPNL